MSVHVVVCPMRLHCNDTIYLMSNELYYWDWGICLKQSEFKLLKQVVTDWEFHLSFSHRMSGTEHKRLMTELSLFSHKASLYLQSLFHFPQTSTFAPFTVTFPLHLYFYHPVFHLSFLLSSHFLHLPTLPYLSWASVYHLYQCSPPSFSSSWQPFYVSIPLFSCLPALLPHCPHPHSFPTLKRIKVLSIASIYYCEINYETILSIITSVIVVMVLFHTAGLVFGIWARFHRQCLHILSNMFFSLIIYWKYFF